MEPGSRKRKYPDPKEDECPTKREKIVKMFCLDIHNLPSVPPLNAFERGYQVESILDMVQKPHNEHFLFVKFKNLPSPELVSFNVVLEKVPEMLDDFCKEYVQAWVNLYQSRKKEP